MLQVSIVVSGTEAKVLNGWSMPEQNLQHVSNLSDAELTLSGFCQMENLQLQNNAS